MAALAVGTSLVGCGAGGQEVVSRGESSTDRVATAERPTPEVTPASGVHEGLLDPEDDQILVYPMDEAEAASLPVDAAEVISKLDLEEVQYGSAPEVFPARVTILNHGRLVSVNDPTGAIDLTYERHPVWIYRASKLSLVRLRSFLANDLQVDRSNPEVLTPSQEAALLGPGTMEARLEFPPAAIDAATYVGYVIYDATTGEMIVARP